MRITHFAWWWRRKSFPSYFGWKKTHLTFIIDFVCRKEAASPLGERSDGRKKLFRKWNEKVKCSSPLRDVKRHVSQSEKAAIKILSDTLDVVVIIISFLCGCLGWNMRGTTTKEKDVFRYRRNASSAFFLNFFFSYYKSSRWKAFNLWFRTFPSSSQLDLFFVTDLFCPAIGPSKSEREALKRVSSVCPSFSCFLSL